MVVYLFILTHSAATIKYYNIANSQTGGDIEDIHSLTLVLYRIYYKCVYNIRVTTLFILDFSYIVQSVNN